MISGMRSKLPVLAPAAALFLISGSCVAPKKPVATAPTQTDRLLAAYPEIQNGRLLILADFENEKQMSIFRLDSASNPGRMARDPKKGRSETGTAALAATLASPNESVVVSSPQQGEWFLKRDWRPYDLLMFAVESPVQGLMLEVEIVGGADGQAVEARTEAPLVQGWNQLRFDLIEVGEQVPLDDIQQIRLSILNPPAAPTTLHFDDFLLAGNQHDIFGSSGNKSGQLYVQGAGRHWNIGAGGRFELSFRYGQITALYHLAADPYRLRNLVRGTSLGPVFVDSATLQPKFSGRQSVATRQRIVEMNPVRIVVECTTQPANPGEKSNEVLEKRTYTIYSTGQIFVSAYQGDAGDESAAVSIAVHTAWSSASPTVTVPGSRTQSSDPATTGTPAYSIIRYAENDTAILVIPFPDPGATEMRHVADSESRVSSLTWSTATRPQGRTPVRYQLVLATPSELDDETARARALDYALPGSIRIDLGQPLSSAFLRADGFDPGSGSYRITTDGNRARLTIDGKKQPSFSPVFEINGQSGGEAWMYVNHLVHQPVVRGEQGEALFQIPGVVRKPISVEPLFKR